MDSYGDAEIYRKSYSEALEVNANTVDQIEKCKKELEDARSVIEETEKYLFVNAMVPIGSKAMMKGKFVHTNEVTVSLGDRWFLKTSCRRALEVCDRMIERCDKNIREFTRESDLLDANLKMPDEIGVFSDGMLKDIVEPYDEEYEAYWREEHKRRFREYKQQEMRSQLTDEAVFEKLDVLQKEEEKGLVTREDDMAESTTTLCLDDWPLRNTKDSEIPHCCSRVEKKTKRVSFSNENINLTAKNTDEECVIRFEHSLHDLKFSEAAANGEIISPNDIYRQFLGGIPLKSALKSTTIKSNNTVEKGEKSVPYFSQRSSDKTLNIIGDVVEKSVATSRKIDKETRPSSKFKSSQNKRS